MESTTLARPRSNGPQTIKDLLEQARPKVAAVVPRHLDPERLMRVALVTISRNPMLAQCTPESLLMCFMQGAELGLSFGTAIGEAYLVPFRNGKTGRYEATFIVGYRGLAALARRSGSVQSIQAEVVRQGDTFEWEYGLDEKLRHKPSGNTAADITHAWACAKFKDGGHQFVVLSVSEVNGIRACSKACDSGPWVTNYAEMAKKTAFRRLAKWLQLSPEFERAVELDNEAEEPDLIDVPQLPAGENGGQSKSANVAEQVRRGRKPRLPTEEPAPEPTNPYDQGAPDSDMPPVESGDVPFEPPAEVNEPSPREKVVIALMEKCGCSRDAALTAIENRCRTMFTKKFDATSPPGLASLMRQIGTGELTVEVK